MALMYPRVTCSSSFLLSSFGLTTTPPFDPPKGILTTAHLSTIRKARSFTWSMVSSGWNLRPPLEGPLASLYCTLWPTNIFILPECILTGKCTVNDLLGMSRRSSSSDVSPRSEYISPNSLRQSLQRIVSSTCIRSCFLLTTSPSSFLICVHLIRDTPGTPRCYSQAPTYSLITHYPFKILTPE